MWCFKGTTSESAASIKMTSAAVSAHSGAGSLSLMSCVRDSTSLNDSELVTDVEKNVVSSRKRFWNPRKWFKRRNKIAEETTNIYTVVNHEVCTVDGHYHRRPNSKEIRFSGNTLRNYEEGSGVVVIRKKNENSSIHRSSRLSVSHDSVFHSPHSGSEMDLDEAQSTPSLMVPQRPLVDIRLQTELNEKLRRRRGLEDTSEDDEGLPHSPPCNSPTTTSVDAYIEKTVITNIKDLHSKSHSTCSDGSLLSVDSYDMEEDSLGHISQDSSKLSLNDRNKSAEQQDVFELDGSTISTPLNHSGAHHRVAIRPKRRAPNRKNRTSQQPSSVLPTTLENLNEQSRLTTSKTMLVNGKQQQDSDFAVKPSPPIQSFFERILPRRSAKKRSKIIKDETLSPETANSKPPTVPRQKHQPIAIEEEEQIDGGLSDQLQSTGISLHRSQSLQQPSNLNRTTQQQSVNSELNEALLVQLDCTCDLPKTSLPSIVKSHSFKSSAFADALASLCTKMHIDDVDDGDNPQMLVVAKKITKKAISLDSVKYLQEEASKKHRPSPMILGETEQNQQQIRPISLQHQSRKFSTEDMIEIVDKSAADSSFEELQSLMKTKKKMKEVVTLRTRSISLDSLKCVAKKRPITAAMVNLRPKKTSMPNNYCDDQPELMKVFARRSLKLRDSFNGEFEDDVGIVEADEARINVEEKGCADVVEAVPAQNIEEVPALPIPSKIVTNIHSLFEPKSPSPKHVKDIEWFTNRLNANSRISNSSNDNSDLVINPPPSPGNGDDEKSSIKNVLESNAVMTSLPSPAEKDVGNNGVEVKNFRQRKAEWEKRAQEAQKRNCNTIVMKND